MVFELEVIAFNIESCHIIQKAGAHRVELCDNVADGGTTPSYGFIKKARAILQIELFPIIRPRGGDFLYNDDEFIIMQEDVLLCKQLGCDGVVFGLLHADGRIDKERTKKLVSLAYPMEVTFHRAFDRVANAAEALEDVIDCGCTRILTSGQRPTANEGIENIAALVQQAGDRIIIMPGSGVRANNIAALATATNASAFHSSAKIVQSSKMNFAAANMHEQSDTVIADAAEIENILRILGIIDNQFTIHD